MFFAEHDCRRDLQERRVFGQAPAAHCSGDALCQDQWGDGLYGGEGQTQVLHGVSEEKGGQFDQ